jgi:hypothetical protein
VYKKVWALVCSILLMFCMAGCSTGGGKVDYADDEAMKVIASGWCQRQDALQDVQPSDSNYLEEVKNAIQVEIDKDTPLKDRQFENAEMQADVNAYIDSLNEQMNVTNSYGINTYDYYLNWKDAYDKRSVLLKKFVDQYGFSVPSKYQSSLDELVANGVSAKEKDSQEDALNALVASASWEKKSSYGSYTYTAIVENTSSYDFTNVSLDVSLYDASGVKTETYTGVNSWKKGEKVKFEAFGTVDAQRVEATVSSFEVAG